MPGYNGGIGGDNENNTGNNAGGGWGNGFGGGGESYQNSIYNNPINITGDGNSGQMGNMTQDQFNAMMQNYQDGINNPHFSDIKGAGLYGANQAASLYAQDPALKTTSDMTQSSYDKMNALSNNGWLNTGVNNLNNNPFMAALQGFGSQQNTALDASVNRAQEMTRDNVNSQFGMGGRGMSGMHNQITTRELGGLANDMYSQNYNNDQNRLLNAANFGASHNINTANAMNDFNTSARNNAITQNTLGRQQDEQQYFNDNSGWNQLQNYSDIVAGLNGTQPADRPKSSSTDQLMGLLSMGAAFL